MSKAVEAIILYMKGEGDLLPSQETKFGELKLMVSLIMEHADDLECLSLYQHITGNSQATAYRDMADAKVIAGDLHKINKEFELIRLYNSQKRIMEKAEKAGDFRAANGAHANLIKYGGHDRNQLDPIDLTKYHRRTVLVAFDPSLLPEQVDMPDEDNLKKLLEKLSKPKIDTEEDDYIEYTELREELQRSQAKSS